MRQNLNTIAIYTKFTRSFVFEPFLLGRIPHDTYLNRVPFPETFWTKTDFATDIVSNLSIQKKIKYRILFSNQ